MSDNDSGFGFDPQDFANIPLFKELSKLMSWQGGSVNWDLARQTATGIAGEPRLAIGVDADASAWADAVRVTESWLDEHTTLDAVEGPALALTPQEWVERAAGPGGIAMYVEPIAAGMQKALAEGLADQLPGGMAGLGGMAGAMNPITAMLTGMQVGTIAGHLADQLMGAYSLTVPTLPTEIVATVGDQAAVLAAQSGVSSDEMRFWLALRESIHRRVWAGAEWLMPHLVEQMEAFAAAAEFDPSGLVEQMGGMGAIGPEMLSDPEAMQRLAEQAGGGLEPSDRQRDILSRLQALVSLVAGYADVTVRRAGEGKLPNLDAIEETTLRQRGQQGKGEQFLTRLVGIDLRPDDVSAGRVFCETVLAARGPGGLDVVWSDARHLPTPTEIADPSRWLLRLAADEASGDLAVDSEPLSEEQLVADFEVPDDLSGIDGLDD